jgi:hypothetical protein
VRRLPIFAILVLAALAAGCDTPHSRVADEGVDYEILGQSCERYDGLVLSRGTLINRSGVPSEFAMTIRPDGQRLFLDDPIFVRSDGEVAPDDGWPWSGGWIDDGPDGPVSCRLGNVIITS